MAKIYAIISGKGGVGKTTSAINLGSSLNYLGEDVIIVDANLTTPNLGINLGAPILPITINHVLKNEAKIEEAIYEHESGMKLIPSSLSLKELREIDDHYKKLPELMRKLKKITNFVIMDSAAGLGEEAKSAINACDELIIVTNPEISAVTDALKTIKLAEQENKKIKGLIINRYTGKNYEMSIDDILDMLEIPILGIIPEDEAIKKSQIMKNPVIYTHPRSIAARSYIIATRRILGENLELEEHMKPGLFRRFLRSVGFK